MRILVVDDQASARAVLRGLLQAVPDVVLSEATSAGSALAAVAEKAFDLVLLDIRLSPHISDRGGLDVLAKLRAAADNRTPVVIVTSLSEIADVRAAMRAGAQDYLLKDELSAGVLLPLVERFRAASGHEASAGGENEALRPLVGESAPMRALKRTLLKLGRATATILIRGETGVGKELVARALHDLGPGANAPFVAVNCSTLPPHLMDSLLFGHERGAFTGADKRTRGFFEQAESGTLLLDEIGDLPLELQAKLLRVLETREIQPLGAEKRVPMRARVLASTHLDLEERVSRNAFRHDLLFRLDVVSIDVPPLSERTEDIGLLATTFAAAGARPLELSPDALAWLSARPWPGNVRELRHFIERAALLSSEALLDSSALKTLAPDRRQSPDRSLIDRLAQAVLALSEIGESKLDLCERALIASAMEQAGGNKSQAARLLGIDRMALERRLQKR